MDTEKNGGGLFPIDFSGVLEAAKKLVSEIEAANISSANKTAAIKKKIGKDTLERELAEQQQLHDMSMRSLREQQAELDKLRKQRAKVASDAEKVAEIDNKIANCIQGMEQNSKILSATTQSQLECYKKINGVLGEEERLATYTFDKKCETLSLYSREIACKEEVKSCEESINKLVEERDIAEQKSQQLKKEASALQRKINKETDEALKKEYQERLGSVNEARQLLEVQKETANNQIDTLSKQKKVAEERGVATSETINKALNSVDEKSLKKTSPDVYNAHLVSKGIRLKGQGEDIQSDIKKKQTQKAETLAKLQEASDKKDKKAEAELTKELEELDTSLENLGRELDRNTIQSVTNSKKQEVADKKKERQLQKALKKDPEYQKAVKEERREEFKEKFKENASFGKNLANSLEAIGSAVTEKLKEIDSNINTFYAYQASVEARLQGSDEKYKQLLASTTKNIALSPFVKQEKMIDNIVKLVDTGVAYNVDLRAFLATVSENIATTFEAFDKNLLKIVRIQQADTTAARLGMEASLTKLFNEYFSDTSYLTDAADTISGAILEASAQLTRDSSLAFEYVVQKWLGALYSVGVSNEAVSAIAQGINYLGTGDVEALNSNEALQTLMAMSATRAGISYADILTGGLDAETTNALLQSMVEYLASIASNTDNNQVTKSAYTKLLGIGMSDLRAIQNLTLDSSVIENLSTQSLTYTDAMTELSNQFGEMTTRIHSSQWIDNIVANATAAASTGIGNNLALYGTWKILNIIEGLTGGIPIPSVYVMGNTVDLNQTVTGLAKIPIAGIGMMSSLLGSLGGSGSVGGMFDVNNWGYDEFLTAGASVTGIKKGFASGTSSSSEMSFVNSASGDDVKRTSMQDGSDGAAEDSKVTNQEVQDEADAASKFNEMVLAAITNDKTSVLSELIGARLDMASIVTSMDSITSLLGLSRIFYTLDAVKMSYAGAGGIGVGSNGGMVYTSSSASDTVMSLINSLYDDTTLNSIISSDKIIQSSLSAVKGGAITASSMEVVSSNLSSILSKVEDNDTLVSELQQKAETLSVMSKIYNDLTSSSSEVMENALSSSISNQVGAMYSGQTDSEALKVVLKESIVSAMGESKVILKESIMGATQESLTATLNQGEEDTTVIDTLVNKILERISEGGGLQVKVTEISNDMSAPLYVQSAVV